MTQAADMGSAPRHGKHAAPRGSQGVSRHRGEGVSHAGLRHDVPLVGAPDEQDSPRPIGVDPSETGSFQRIEAGQGATVETRENISKISADSTSSWKRQGYGAGMRLQGESRPQVASRESTYEINKKLVAAIVLVVLLVAALVVWGFDGLLPSKEQGGEQQSVEQAQTSVDSGITYRGTTYSLVKQDSGIYALVGRSATSGSDMVYFELAGTPTQLVLYNGAFIIPENLDGSWDVIAYTIGSGTMGSQVVDASGNPVTGQGQISSVELQDPNLLVTDTSGNIVTVSLV